MNIIRNCLLLLFLTFFGSSFAIDNPVVEIYDGCIMKFGGKFYAMGTGTQGKIYWSDDMITWQGPLLVARSNEAKWLNDPKYGDQSDIYPRIGAGDLMHHNGLFHIYYNGIGHSVSLWPTQMFKETCIDAPFTAFDIDAQLFIEENGNPIFIKKVQKVHPISGNNLGAAPKQTWYFPLKTPFSFGNNPFTGDKQGKFLNSGVKGGNDFIDKNNFEGPELYKYRSNYYLLNSGSCMSARTGYYNAFCTQSESLETMSNNSKLPVAVLERNLEKFHLQYTPIAPFSEWVAWPGRTTTLTPAANWMNTDFDDSAWTLRNMGMGFPKQDRDVDIRHVRTLWDGSWKNVWVRREFIADAVPVKPFLLYRSEGNFEYYLNGNLLFTENGNYIGWRTKEISPVHFKPGKNVLAVKCSSSKQTRYFDVGVYDAGQLSVEDPVMGPSQLNVLLGKNGFEHFVVYKAFWNGISSLGVDRVFFRGRRFFTNGPTTAKSNGYHPAPSAPSMHTDFSTSPNQLYWHFNNKEWSLTGKRAKSVSNESKVLNLSRANNYFIETSFALPPQGSQTAGLILHYHNEDNWVQVNVSRSLNKWIVKQMINGTLSVVEKALPDKFMFFEPNSFIQETTPAWHEMRAYKNGKRVEFWLDHFQLTINEPIIIEDENAGFCGIIAAGNDVNFEHITYTKGWDEYGQNISAWVGDMNKWNSGKNGISYTGANIQPELLFKGDDLTNFNYEINIENEELPTDGEIVLFPTYTNEDNFVRAKLDYGSKQWGIEEVSNGKTVSSRVINAGSTFISTHTTPATGHDSPVSQYVYQFDNECIVSGIKVLWMEGAYPFIKANFAVPTSLKVQYLSNNLWVDVPQPGIGQQQLGIYNQIEFLPVKTKSLRIITTAPTARHCRPYNIEVKADIRSGFFFSAVRNGGSLKLFADNIEIASLSHSLPAGKVGFGTNIQNCTFDGIMVYQNGITGNNELSDSPIVLSNNLIPGLEGFRMHYYDSIVRIEAQMPNNKYNVNMYDLKGRKVYQKLNVMGNNEFDVSFLKPSVYLLAINCDRGLFRVNKIMVN